jgi:hypothetical protein
LRGYEPAARARAASGLWGGLRHGMSRGSGTHPGL